MEKKKNSTDASNRKRFPDGLRNLQARQEYVSYIDHSSIRVRTAEKDPSLEDHWHSAAEITLMLQGEATYSLPDKTYRLTDGQILSGRGIGFLAEEENISDDGLNHCRSSL